MLLPMPGGQISKAEALDSGHFQRAFDMLLPFHVRKLGYSGASTACLLQ